MVYSRAMVSIPVYMYTCLCPFLYTSHIIYIILISHCLHIYIYTHIGCPPPSTPKGIDPFESQVCAAVKVLGQEEADLRMIEHLATWFTSEDFDKLQANGIQDIRIPLG